MLKRQAPERARPVLGRKRRISGLGVVFAVGVLACVAGAVSYPFIALGPRAGLGSAPLGGPFDLVDQAGRRVTERDLSHKPFLIAFGFTSCPDVCPTTLTHMTNWLQALGPDGDRLNVVYVTIDPERDTPQRLRAFLSAFDPRIRGLTGSPAAIADIAREYRAYYRKAPLAGGGYTMDHASNLYLMDARGRFVRPIAFDQPDAEVLTALRQALK